LTDIQKNMDIQEVLIEIKKNKKEYTIYHFYKGKCPLIELQGKEIKTIKEDKIVLEGKEIPINKIKTIKKGNKVIWKR
jgi:uncharacterized protein (UPF0248 family)